MLDLSDPDLAVAPLESSEESEWQAFLDRSSNGMLFHDLRFLAYHSPGRHRFHHLIIRKHAELVALVPGGLVQTGNGINFVSPLGASVGGLGVGRNCGGETVIACVSALQQYGVREGWSAIEIVLPPGVYAPRTGDLVSFALHVRGFDLHWRQLVFALALDVHGPQQFERRFQSRQRTDVRASQRGGVTVRLGGAGLLDGFAPMFEATYRRLKATPTHTIDEIRALLCRLPDRVRLVLAEQGTRAVSGLLVLRLAREVAAIFDICRAPPGERGNALTIAALMDDLAADGATWLDLGPSASTDRYNTGVAFFKRGMGATTLCRDHWRWTVSG
jgi:hypothetical protein